MKRQSDHGKKPVVRLSEHRRPGTRSEPPANVEGVFRSEAVAEAVAERLRAAFPDRVVTVENGDAPLRVRVRPGR